MCIPPREPVNRRSEKLFSDMFSGTLEALDLALQPFLLKGWLTTVDTRNLGAPPKQSALTIIITGGASPPQSILSSLNPIRYMFYDAPLKELDDGSVYTPAISPMASATFSSLVGSRWVIPHLAKKKILQYVNMAHEKGIAVRVTEPIDFPVWIRYVVAPFPALPTRSLNIRVNECRNLSRNLYWQILLDCGVDWLDVDDLYSASRF